MAGGSQPRPPVTSAVLGNPAQYPPELKSWLAKTISGNKLFQISDNQLTDGMRALLVNALDLTDTGVQVLAGTLNAAALEVGGKALPGTLLAYNTIGATKNVASTSSASPTTIIAGSANNFDGGPVLAEFYCAALRTPTVAGASIVVSLADLPSGFIGDLVQEASETAAGRLTSASARIAFTPSAGTHTYSITAWATSLTGPPQIISGGSYAPAYLRLTKV